jgi:hypothetical protein
MPWLHWRIAVRALQFITQNRYRSNLISKMGTVYESP